MIATSSPTYAPSASTNIDECIFLGTGTSGSLPQIECLTREPDAPQCHTCLAALTPEGKHNRRRNTSVALRLNGRNGKKATVVIDVGKNFAAAALEWFPRYNLRKIDAVLITHSHADAMNGLDDLRAWTLNHAIQSSIDIYVSQDTFSAVLRSFPYLVSKAYASGGGDVPELKWHVIEAGVPFEIGETGIEVTPFEVHHGQIFSTSPSCCETSTDTRIAPLEKTLANTPTLSFTELAKATTNTVHPYMCMAFNIANKIVYMSDVSFIPESAWKIIDQIPASRGGPLPVLVLDCLGLEPFTSHFCLAQSIEAARRARPLRTYLTGFDHGVTHEQYVGITERVGDFGSSRTSLQHINSLNVGHLVGKGDPIWMRPAHDGLQLTITSAHVRDSTYNDNAVTSRWSDATSRWPKHVGTFRQLTYVKQTIGKFYSLITVLASILMLLFLCLH